MRWILNYLTICTLRELIKKADFSGYVVDRDTNSVVVYDANREFLIFELGLTVINICLRYNVFSLCGSIS